MSDPNSPPSKKHGCFFYGCVTSLVLVLIVAIGVVLGVRFVAGRLNAMIAEYTETTPMVLPKSDMSADELKQLNDRVDAFSKAVDAHTNSPTLTLTSREINGLIASRQSLHQIKDSVYVTLDGDLTKGQLSLPLDKLPQFPLLHTKGRYLNGSGSFAVSITNGVLDVTIQSLEARGKPVPDEALAKFRNQNLADGFNKDPKQSANLSHVDSLQVTNGTLIITGK